MIEPLEKVKFKKRERLVVDRNFFLDAVKKMRDDKLKNLLEQDFFDLKEKKEEAAHRIKFEMSQELLNKMNRIVQVQSAQ